MIPSIPTTQLIPTDELVGDPAYQGLKIIRTQSSAEAHKLYSDSRYRFQHETIYTIIRATLTRKGMVAGESRLSVFIHPSLEQFTNIVQYDPSAPPDKDYYALGMKEAHDQTQSDFKGQKATNRDLFKEYLLESILGSRTAYLPSISGWQTAGSFAKTVFVAFDEDDADALYGLLYLPKAPIMQADGQTQTAALFALAKTKDAMDLGALDKFRVTLEIELNVDVRKAGQSFADRNGRGSKKNKNLVIGLDTSSALSELRVKSIEGTIFEQRLSYGRNTPTSETATKAIVDLSTMEQMLMRVVCDGTSRPETFKHHHVAHFLPYTRQFVLLLESLFADQWQIKTPAKQDTFRKLYIHGWPFALKAIASSYHRARIAELGPLAQAFKAHNAGMGLEEGFLEILQEKQKDAPETTIALDELTERLKKIDWLRYRAHWVKLTGPKLKDGKARKFKLKSSGDEKVAGQAQNTSTVINNVKDKILSSSWEDLTATVDAT